MRIEVMKVATILFACATLAACNGNGCSGTSDKADYVRGLSKAEFVEIYEAASELYRGRERFDFEGELPEVLKKHGVIFVRVQWSKKEELLLRLNGCMDSWVDIVVVEKASDPKIELRYGFNSREVMWRKNDV